MECYDPVPEEIYDAVMAGPENQPEMVDKLIRKKVMFLDEEPEPKRKKKVGR